MRRKKQEGPITFAQAKEKAMRLIEFRAHTERELRDKLRRAEAVDEDIDTILEFCKEYNLVNDRTFALAKARDLANLKKLGKRRIEQELKRLGIADEYIYEATAFLDDEDACDTLMPLVAKKLHGDFEKKNKDKAIRYFMYRGYGFEDIRNCIERIENGL